MKPAMSTALFIGALVAAGGLAYFGKDGALNVYVEPHANHCYRILKRIIPTPDTVRPTAVFDYEKDGDLHVTVQVSLENTFGARVRTSLFCKFKVPDSDPFGPFEVSLEGVEMPKKFVDYHNGIINLDIDR